MLKRQERGRGFELIASPVKAARVITWTFSLSVIAATCWEKLGSERVTAVNRNLHEIRGDN